MSAPEGVRLREAVGTDYAQVAAVVDEWWGGPTAQLLHPLFFVHFQSTTFVAERGESLSGFLCGFLSQTYPRTAYVHLVAVHPAERRTGLGHRLYERLFDAARQAGRTRIEAVTSPVNTGSVRFHEALGFTSGRVDDYVGSGEPRVVFALDLDAATGPAPNAFR